MARLLERLQDAARSGVYRVGSTREIVQALAGGELAMATVDLREPVFDAFSRALEFPAWFGRNWDALEDCLTDLSWREAPGHVIFLEGFQSLPREEREVLIDVLAAASEFWAGERKPFFAVFVDPGRTLPLKELFRGA